MRKFNHLQGLKMVFWIKWGLKMNKIGHKMDQKVLKIHKKRLEIVLLTQKYLCFFAKLGYLLPICGFFLADVDLERIPLN